MGPDAVEAVLIIATLGALTTIGIGILRTVRHYFDRKFQGAGDVEKLHAEVEHLRERVESADDARERLADLEERLDFAERVLAQQREAGRIGPGHP